MSLNIKSLVVSALLEIAPEVDTANLEWDVPLRDQFDFDSVDFLNFAIKLQDQAKITIPELDFPKLATLNGCISYIKTAKR